MNSTPFRLRTGDIVHYQGQSCPVVRVTECAAVVAVTQPWREFTTLGGQRVQFQPAPKRVRISANAAVPILNRQG